MLCLFLISTHAPLRGATSRSLLFGFSTAISTHAPLRGATSVSRSKDHPSQFLLTRLCEARHINQCIYRDALRFLLTRLCEARPAGSWRQASDTHFYSRASARRDFNKNFGSLGRSQFLLTRLCEARHYAKVYIADPITISTHAPLRGATRFFDDNRRTAQNFYSRASARRDGPRPLCSVPSSWISTHAPLRGATKTTSQLHSLLQFLLTRLCEARPLHLVPNGSHISIYRKRRTLFQKKHHD